MCMYSYASFLFSPETDMFFLAISMVGTDFSLIGRLFPHRARAEIKVDVKTLNPTSKHLVSVFCFLFLCYYDSYWY